MMETPTVLVVSDDVAWAERLVGALAHDYVVRAARYPAEALHFMAHDHVHAIVLDLPGSGQEGLIVLSRARCLRPRPHILVLSDAKQPAQAVKAMRLGASDYLVKPCGPGAVCTAVEEMLVAPAVVCHAV